MTTPTVPIIDLSAFVNESVDLVDEKKKLQVIGEVSQACSEYGFFQILNHGVPLDLLNDCLHMFKTFFDCSTEEKLKYSAISSLFPDGYGVLDNFVGNNQRFLMYPPGSAYNTFTTNPPLYQEKLDECFKQIQKLASIIESIINEALGLPKDCLKKLDNNRSTNAMVAWHYPPVVVDGESNVGRNEHQDSNCVTIVFQDQVGGLQVKKDGAWIPVPIVKGALVVNIGVIIQVLSNKRFIAARHRVVRHEASDRYSIAFVYTFDREIWIQPLSELTEESGEEPKYRGFVFKEYMEMVLKQLKSSTRPEEIVPIDQFGIPSS